MSKMEHSRFTDEGWYLRAYSKYGVLISCSKCGEQGEVKANWEDNSTGIYGWHARFTCQKCALKLVRNREQHDWAGEVGFSRKRCDFCGYKWVETKETAKPFTKNRKKVVHCPNCKTENTLQADPTSRISATKLACEPDFGLPLYLQTDCRFGIFWAYNLEHLNVLESFVLADLRETLPEAGNSSMISRLPLWIKSKKNKDLILKLIERLKYKAQLPKEER